MKLISIFSIITTLLICTSCESVKPYQKAYLNDKDMGFSIRKADRSEQNFQSYREGSSGGLGGKAGGGCGCN